MAATEVKVDVKYLGKYRDTLNVAFWLRLRLRMYVRGVCWLEEANENNRDVEKRYVEKRAKRRSKKGAIVGTLTKPTLLDKRFVYSIGLSVGFLR